MARHEAYIAIAKERSSKNNELSNAKVYTRCKPLRIKDAHGKDRWTRAEFKFNSGADT